jgi:hypothetical protein
MWQLDQCQSSDHLSTRENGYSSESLRFAMKHGRSSLMSLTLIHVLFQTEQTNWCFFKTDIKLIAINGL